MKTVIAAIDLGPLSSRVLYHAAGFAKLLSLELRVLHVVRAPAPDDVERVREFCRRHGPYEVDFENVPMIVSPGIVSDVILRKAIGAGAGLVVLGSRGHSRLANLVLGSTSAAVLRGATMPILLVPPTDFEIVDIADRVRLTSGSILNAIDLAEHCDRQLEMAADLSRRSGQPLLLMTVAPERLNERHAVAMLRDRGHELHDVKPHAMIVRRGDIAEEISRCAQAEDAGLVVMGLRARPRGTPGAIASAVINTRRAFVLAVPGC